MKIFHKKMEITIELKWLQEKSAMVAYNAASITHPPLRTQNWDTSQVTEGCILRITPKSTCTIEQFKGGIQR